MEHQPNFMTRFAVRSPNARRKRGGLGNATVAAMALKAVTLSGSPVTAEFDAYASLTDDDEVLINEQADSADNGIYVIDTGGAWSRSSVELTSGMLVSVRNGTRLGGTLWMLQTDPGFEVDTDDLDFIECFMGDVIGVRASSVATGVPTTPCDGVTLAAGDLVLQASITSSAHGVYRYNGSVCYLVARPMAVIVGGETGTTNRRRIFVKASNGSYSEIFAGILGAT